MRTLFIDTEFNGFRGSLISMALVSEDGREWYESVGCDDPVPWVAEHVMPIINRGPCPYGWLQHSLSTFLSQFDAVHIVADWPEDIKHFCQVLITGPGTRLDTPPLTFEVRRDLDDAVSDLPHNALEDARGIMRFVTEQQPASEEKVCRWVRDDLHFTTQCGRIADGSHISGSPSGSCFCGGRIEGVNNHEQQSTTWGHRGGPAPVRRRR